jgi:hypothetical protein
MKDPSNLHLKIQELCDCFATTDPLQEMYEMAQSPEELEGELKWIALAVLHGINSNAEKITLTADKEGNVEVSAKYRKMELPSPGPELGRKVIEAMRDITHIEKDRGRMTLALGIRDSNLDLEIKSSRKEEKNTIKILFP